MVKIILIMVAIGAVIVLLGCAASRATDRAIIKFFGDIPR